jgi:RND family efflux transporter MFP subunit
MIIPECDSSKPLPSKARIVIFLLAVLVLGAGVFTAVRFIQTRPKPPQRPPAAIAPLVEVMTAQAGPQNVLVQAMGTVVPSRRTFVRPEVSGVVREVSPDFLPGATVKAGAPLLRLEAEDFRLAVSARQADLDSVRAALDLELGYQKVARHELELLQKSGKALEDPNLALRKPQLAQARARVLQAETALDQARLDLKRTTVTAPFTALVLDKQVEVGSRVTPTDTLAALVDAREYWVETTLPVDRLPWILLPDKDGAGSAVTVRSLASGAEREGRILRLRGDLEDQGRLARLLVSLPRPLEASPAPILLGEYVRLDVQGRRLDQVVRLPRSALRENDTVWAVQNGTLDIRPVSVAWRDTETVLVEKGLSTGETVVTSQLGTPIQGMPLTLAQGAGN